MTVWMATITGLWANAPLTHPCASPDAARRWLIKMVTENPRNIENVLECCAAFSVIKVDKSASSGRVSAYIDRTEVFE